MDAQIILDSVRIDTGSADCDGRLAYRAGRLIAILTQLDPDLHEELGVGRHWFLEVGFGPAASAPRPLTFPTLDEARAWLAGCVDVPAPCLRDVPSLRRPHEADAADPPRHSRPDYSAGEPVTAGGHGRTCSLKPSERNGSMN
jgi:hypothetical protein